MIAKSFVATVLWVFGALGHRVRIDALPSDDFVRECCFGNVDTIEHRKNCYAFTNENHTVTMISYVSLKNISDASCCTTCLENTFETEDGQEERSANEQEDTTAAAAAAASNSNTSATQFCFETCFSDGRAAVRTRTQWNYSEARGRGFSDSIPRSNDTLPRFAHCDTLFASLNFWGANIVIFANIIYIIPYLVVALVYFTVPGLGARAYNKAVICYNVTQIILNGILIGIGVCVLCHVPARPDLYVYSGLTIMFLTISSTFWLFVICIDMTSVITRFRGVLLTETNKRHERRKFFTYASWVWGGSLLPTIIACVAEVSPILPKSSPVRPNFSTFQSGANFTVIVYVATLPALTCVANTVLFCYTSYRMILIQRSTSVATANSTTATIDKIRRRYFLFLRLYFLMDAPWITSALAAAFTDLWILKFLRMIQPILMLFAILPPRTTSRLFTRGCLFRKRSTANTDPLERRIS